MKDYWQLSEAQPLANTDLGLIILSLYLGSSHCLIVCAAVEHKCSSLRAAGAIYSDLVQTQNKQAAPCPTEFTLLSPVHPASALPRSHSMALISFHLLLLAFPAFSQPNTTLQVCMITTWFWDQDIPLKLFHYARTGTDLQVAESVGNRETSEHHSPEHSNSIMGLFVYYEFLHSPQNSLGWWTLCLNSLPKDPPVSSALASSSNRHVDVWILTSSPHLNERGCQALGREKGE